MCESTTRGVLGPSPFETLISLCYSQWQRSLEKPGPVSHKCLSQKCYSRELRSICCFYVRAVNLESIHKCLPYNPIFHSCFIVLNPIIFFYLQTSSCSRTTVCPALSSCMSSGCSGWHLSPQHVVYSGYHYTVVLLALGNHRLLIIPSDSVPENTA